MAPDQANAAFVWRQFIDLGRSNSKKSKRYRCRHCQKDFAATSVGRPKEHLAACVKWQAKQRQERQAQYNTCYLPSYSEAIQKKITEVGIQHISQDESHSYAYDAAAAVIAGGRPFSLFQSRRWRYFFTRIKPSWKPPSRAAITRILPDFYQELYDDVFKRITSSEWFNIIFDASDNVSRGPDGLFNKHSAVYDDGFKPAMAWQCLLNQGSILARVAVKADMQAFIFMNDHVLDLPKDQKYAHKRRWADLEEKDWLELEDSYLELFVNAQRKKVWMDGMMASTSVDFEWEGVLQSTGDMPTTSEQFIQQRGARIRIAPELRTKSWILAPVNLGDNICGRWRTASLTPIISLYGESPPSISSNMRSEWSRVDKEKFGPQLPRVEAEQKTESFCKVKVICQAKSIRDVADAHARLVENPNHLTANAIVGLELLRVVEHHYEDERARESIRSLSSFQYDNCNQQYADVAAEFKKCTELMPGLSDAHVRLEAHQAYLQDSNEEVLRTCLIRTMIETPLQTQYEAMDQAEGKHITLNPIRETGQRGSDDDTDEEYSV
ncbi:transposase [Fusarium beomiforme]|uniref:Transposase n=1 Tax=Fusarium beomiforme TaxID=44412 RepID=A0A9P5A8F5_9HYPO|nr:transposase [Fusarium beomiforme]